MRSVALIGVGNILFWDEGIGVYAAEYMRRNFRFEPDIVIVDGGTLGFGLMNYLREFDSVVLLDTLSFEGDAGEIYVLPEELLKDLGDVRRTAHEVEVSQMLDIVSLEGDHAKVSLIGIIPEDIATVGFGLSKVLQENFESLIEAIMDHLQSHGIKIESLSKRVGLFSIIDGFMKR